MFNKYDTNKNGSLNFEQFTEMMVDFNLAPTATTETIERKEKCLT